MLAAGTRMLTIVIVEEFEPGHVLDTFEGTASPRGVPTMVIAMMEHPTFKDRDLSSLTTITSGGSTVPAALVERFEREVGAKLTIVFGQTEMSPVATMTRPDDSVDDKANSLGTALPHVEIKIVDPDGNTVPIGEPENSALADISNGATTTILKRQKRPSTLTGGSTQVISARWTNAGIATSLAGSKT